MNDQGVRKMVIDALHKVTGASNNSERAARLQDSKINMAIADLGIDSLDAIEWCMEIEARSGVELDPVEITTHDSIDELVGLIVNRSRRAGIADEPQLARVPRDGPLPLSLGQESIWRNCHTHQVSAAFVLGLSDRLLGVLNVAVLRDCLNYIVRRHEILRTTFTVLDRHPMQIIHPAEPIVLPVFDLGDETEPDEAAARIIKVEMARVVDLTQGPLVRFSLIRIRENEHLLLRVCHHILWDARSTGQFRSELALLYSAKLEGAAFPLSESEHLQIADYAAWQRKALSRDGPTYQETVAWWKERFQQQLPMSDLPFKRSAAVAGLDPTDGVTGWRVDSGVAQRLTRLGEQERATPYVVWLAALVVLLAAETGQRAVIVGTYVTNRRGAATQNMMGYFSNLATLGFQVNYASTFRGWLSEVRIQVAATEARCEIPHEELREELQRLGVNLPEVSVIFGAGHAQANTHFAGLALTPTKPVYASMPWGFSIDVRLLQGSIAFDAGIYDPVGVRQFIGHLNDLLDAISYHPDLPLGELLALREAV